MIEQSVLRKRSGTSSISTTSGEADDMLPGKASGLSANSMLGASPTQHGAVYKLHVPLLYTLLPTFLQRFVCSYGIWLLSWLVPHWTERYLIQIGSYLYKFKSLSANNPKGTALPLEAVEAQIVSGETILDGVEFAFLNLPSDCTCVIRIATLRKQHFYAISSREEAQAWIHSLHEGRQETITRSMGHARGVPYPKSWEYFDTLGRNHIRSKERVRRKLQESETRNMDMSKIGDGGPGPRGYFG